VPAPCAEGTRSGDGSIGEFRPGAFYLAQKSGAPVVPVYLDGGYRAIPKGGFRVRPAELLVRVLPPLSPGEGAGGSKERIAVAVRERILAARACSTSIEGDIPSSTKGER